MWISPYVALAVVAYARFMVIWWSVAASRQPEELTITTSDALCMLLAIYFVARYFAIV